MKIILICLSIILSVSSCKKKEITTRNYIEGKAPGVFNGMRVYLNKLGPNNRPVLIDTAIVMDNQFHFNPKENVQDPDVRFLTMDTGKERFVFLEENKPLDITIYQDSLQAGTTTGGKENDLFNLFKQKQADYQKEANQFKTARGEAYRSGNQVKGDQITREWMNSEEFYKKFTDSLIKINPDRLVSSMIIGELVNSKLIDSAKARKLFDSLDEKVKKYRISQSLESFLLKSEVTNIGNKAPVFEGKSPEGKIIKLEEIMGKVTLIDFWASWCGPCRRENPNVVAAYKKYHSKGFNIISISLDRPNAEAAWKAAIKKDQMDWYHISRLQHWNDPIAKQYGVSSIPATFLIDENGVIIAKNLRGQSLHNKLEEVL